MQKIKNNRNTNNKEEKPTFSSINDEHGHNLLTVFGKYSVKNKN